MRPITFAHRGARTEAPENTIEAFRRALELGATGLETDAWLSSDGEVVLVHDDAVRVGRLRKVAVKRTGAGELARYGVPRLAELYDTLGVDFELSVDLKGLEAASATIAVARAAGAEERLWLCSGSSGLLKGLRETTSARLVHSTTRRVIDVPLERHASNLASAGVDAVNFHHTDWTAGLVGLYHRFDLRAFAWDVQTVRQLRAALALRLDGLYCDDVRRMVATVGEWTVERADD